MLIDSLRQIVAQRKAKMFHFPILYIIVHARYKNNFRTHLLHTTKHATIQHNISPLPRHTTQHMPNTPNVSLLRLPQPPHWLHHRRALCRLTFGKLIWP